MNSADGIDDADVVSLNVGDHIHLNWGFTAPGVYRVGLQAVSQLADANGQAIQSPPATLVFDIGESGLPLQITNVGDTSIRIRFPFREGLSYQVQSRANLGTAPWTDLDLDTALQPDASGSHLEAILSVDQAAQFYRVLQR